ncbi:MAG: TldD/PmbA family protein [Candidatus Aenigmarchaeota archaeon]|nr:TldD/PmbA family protein [Candidatus Aenigmarchaeota archaeon]
MNRLKRVLESIKGVDDFQVSNKQTKKTNMIFSDNDQKCSIQTSDKLTTITVYNRKDSEETTIGSSSGELSMLTEEAVSKLAETLVENARTQNNKNYLLVSPGYSYPRIELVDRRILDASTYQVNQLGRELYERMREESRLQGVVLTNVEVNLSSGNTNLMNSRDLDLSQQRTGIYIELTALAIDGKTREEFTTITHARKLEDINPEALVQECAKYALESLRKVNTPNHEGTVVITGPAVKDFFTPSEASISPIGHPLLQNAHSAMKYSGNSSLSIGDLISRETPLGDRLTIASDASIPFGVSSTNFGDDGLPGQRVVFVEDGIFTRFLANNQYYQYMDIKPTGPVGNIVVAPGNTSYEDLLSGDKSPKVIVYAFSWFNPDKTSGDFSSEIRFGYYFDGNNTYPIKGGLVSGNWFTSLKDIRLANETTTRGNYIGPLGIRLENMRVSGI